MTQPRACPRPLTVCRVLAALLAVCVGQAGARAQQGAWQLVWSDEFDGAAIDTTKWNVRHAPGNTNNELQYYASDEVSVSGGMLHLRSQRRSFGGRQYTSGLVETRGKFAQTYGRVEVRARLPHTQGIWPAHWLLPNSGVWPPEIDIMELLGHEPETVYMTNHWGVWPDHQWRTGEYTGPDFSEDFHTFAAEWTPTRIEWYVDDVLRFANNTGVPTGAPFYIILNTAVGGDWPGNPDGTTVFPQFHDIDYVRVWTKAVSDEPTRRLVDYTGAGAVTDGIIQPGEYAAQVHGINTGWGDRIGVASRLLVDSDTTERLYLGIDGVVPWPPAPTPDGVVFYIDSKPGGVTSTIVINDTGNGTDLGRSMVSGNARTNGAPCNLFFPDGFAADYAIALQDTFAGVFRLATGSVELVTGANLNAAQDIHGGTAVRYMRNPSDATMREVRVRLADLEVTPVDGVGGSLLMFATMLNGDLGRRSNEYLGVAPGNWWDSVITTTADVQLKPGDFIEVLVQPRCLADWDLSGAVNSQDFFAFLVEFFDGTADVNNSGDVSSQDFFDFLTAFFAGCG